MQEVHKYFRFVQLQHITFTDFNYLSLMSSCWAKQKTRSANDSLCEKCWQARPLHTLQVLQFINFKSVRNKTEKWIDSNTRFREKEQ